MSTFALDVARFVEKVGEQAEMAVKKATIDLFSDVVRATPVDTGRAKGNWQPTIGAPAAGQTAALDPSGGGAMSEIVSTVSAGEMGQTFYLSNNLPYIERLEYGSHSKQAPNGMVRLNVQRWQAIIDAAASEVAQ